MANERDYDKQEHLRGKATENLQNIREYEQEIKRGAAISARATARAILLLERQFSGVQLGRRETAWQ